MAAADDTAVHVYSNINFQTKTFEIIVTKFRTYLYILQQINGVRFIIKCYKDKLPPMFLLKVPLATWNTRTRSLPGVWLLLLKFIATPARILNLEVLYFRRLFLFTQRSSMHIRRSGNELINVTNVIIQFQFCRPPQNCNRTVRIQNILS